MNEQDYQKLEQKEKSLEEINKESEIKKLTELFQITEPNHPGAKFRRFFEDMKKKLSLDAKIKRFYFPDDISSFEENTESSNNKTIDINKIINEKQNKFNQLEESQQDIEKYKYIFNNAYHRIILSFFTMIAIYFELISFLSF